MDVKTPKLKLKVRSLTSCSELALKSNVLELITKKKLLHLHIITTIQRLTVVRKKKAQITLWSVKKHTLQKKYMIWKLFLKRLKVEMYFFRSGPIEGNYQKIQKKI